jgi:putative hemolysin
MDEPSLLRWISLVIFLVLSAIFSGSETALTALSKIKVKNLQEKLGEKGEILSLWLKYPDRLLTTILVGNNFVNIAASAIATSIAISYGHQMAVALAAGIMTFVILVFGEIVPKTFARSNSEKIAPKAIRFLNLLSFILAPVVKFLSWISGGIINLVGGKSTTPRHVLDFQDIKLLISAGEREGIIEEEKKEMIEGIFESSTTKVSEIMTPRIDMFTIETGTPIQEALKLIREKGYSRVPVFEENMDNIVGVLYAKDFLKILAEEETKKIKLKDLIREPLFTPESKKLDDLLKDFRKEKTHIAIVVDEYGGTAGLVTIEDVLEEIVGEIEDEFDRDGVLWKKEGPRIFLLDAKIEIDKANEELNLGIPEDDFETVGGFVIDLLGKLPKKGKVFTYKNKKIEVVDADERRIKTLRIEIIDDKDKEQIKEDKKPKK